MKRVLFAVLGTALGLVALLSFKTQGKPLATPPGGLPSAAVSAPASTGGQSSTSTATSAPPNPSTSSASPTTKKYVGSAVQTRYGIVQVQVVASSSHIASVSFVQLTAFDGRSQEINSAAAPILLQETIDAQSAHIDTVSGATYTTDGYEQSLQSALDQAGIK
ncbi:MAG: hypothetical protein QOG01_211 [Pseudonocardiales bacterium]|jgi:uncharacterized protein with FMN-binding domain|nr:hypothetical protein [Pseudonocardiales bacterium]